MSAFAIILDMKNTTKALFWGTLSGLITNLFIYLFPSYAIYIPGIVFGLISLPFFFIPGKNSFISTIKIILWPLISVGAFFAAYYSSFYTIIYLGMELDIEIVSTVIGGFAGGFAGSLILLLAHGVLFNKVNRKWIIILTGSLIGAVVFYIHGFFEIQLVEDVGSSEFLMPVPSILYVLWQAGVAFTFAKCSIVAFTLIKE